MRSFVKSFVLSLILFKSNKYSSTSTSRISNDGSSPKFLLYLVYNWLSPDFVPVRSLFVFLGSVGFQALQADGALARPGRAAGGARRAAGGADLGAAGPGEAADEAGRLGGGAWCREMTGMTGDVYKKRMG